MECLCTFVVLTHIFHPPLQAASDRCSLDTPLSSLGPCVVIFHETLYTELLGEHSTVTSDSPGGGLTDSVSCEEDSDDSPPEFFSTEEASEGDSHKKNNHQMTAEELLRIRYSSC